VDINPLQNNIYLNHTYKFRSLNRQNKTLLHFTYPSAYAAYVGDVSIYCDDHSKHTGRYSYHRNL